jgi:hypothetical protein
MHNPVQRGKVQYIVQAVLSAIPVLTVIAVMVVVTSGRSECLRTDLYCILRRFRGGSTGGNPTNGR